MASLELQTAEVSREAENRLVRLSLGQPAGTRDPDLASAFAYLLREPRHTRRLRRMNITAGIVALVAVATVLYACV